MDKETLSNYGWIVICVLVLAVMIALATPFGKYISNATKSTAAGLFETNKNALSITGIDVRDQEFHCDHLSGTEVHNTTPVYTGDNCCVDCGTILSKGKFVVPQNGTYKRGNITYTAGQEMPDVPEAKDVFIFGDYEYRYKQNCSYGYWQDTSSNGWYPVVLDKTKTEYGEILSEIAGKPLKGVNGTFSGCTSLTTAPEIPSSVTSMYRTFIGCTALTTAPEIPNGVINIMQTFDGCKSLTTAPVIPDNVTDTISYAFRNCTSLTGTIEINANPISCNNCFEGTVNPIILTGSSSRLRGIASTATNGNVTVAQ